MKIIAGNWKMNGTQKNLDSMITDLSSIETENKIRNVLGGSGYQIEKQDGSTINSSKLLPSAFFTIEKLVSSQLDSIPNIYISFIYIISFSIKMPSTSL